MQIPTNKYCGDTKMSGLLEKIDAKFSLTQIYGLFYGCLSAPELVIPSMYHPLVFGEEGAEFETEEDAQTVIGGLMALWNALSRWTPASDDFFLPNIKYESTCGGLVNRLKDDHSFAETFVLGLSLGKVADSDFSQDGRQALEDMAKNSAHIINYAEVLERDTFPEERLDKQNSKIADQLEDIMADCIVRINLGLKAAREWRNDEMRMMSTPPPAPNTKIQRNAPCPCGSGKKYKKCCGLVH